MKIAAFILLLILCIAPVAAALDCPVIAQTAFTVTDQFCADTSRNNACYGHDLLEAQPQPDVVDFIFNQPGQKIDVSQLRSLRLFPLDVTNDVWGVALMRLQASLPSSQPEDVTMLIFGSVELDNAVRPATTQSMTVGAAQNINVRAEPSSTSSVIGTLKPGESVTAVERLADNSWLRVQMPQDSNVTGWVSAPLMTADSSLDSLNVAAANAPFLQAMQSFYFKTNDETAAPCQDIPASGLLIQTPEGMGKVRLWINEVKFQIGSTVFLQAQPGGEMTIKTLEGEALVEAFGVTQHVVAGTQARIQLSEDLKPLAPATFPEPYDLNELQTLPVDHLTEPITIHPPLTREQIQALVSTETSEDNNSSGDSSSEGNVGCSGDSCNTDNTTENNNNCPGNSCNTPGHNDDCPGNSCNAHDHGDNNSGGNNSGNNSNGHGHNQSSINLRDLVDIVLRREF
jgi:SH3 domain-containing protein